MEAVHESSRLKQILNEHEKIVFLGGAGISTESGIRDFRSQEGLYNQPYKYSPEKILSHNFFFNQPKIFYEFYLENIIHQDPKPNAGHHFLKELEDKGKITAVITQNIDGLHQMAGSSNVLELHGNVFHNHCVKCNKEFSLEYIRKHRGTVRCDDCDGLVKPDVTLYGESLDEEVLMAAIEAIRNADLLWIGGTSLNVYPAAGLMRYAKKILLLNKDRTSKDIYCDYVYYGMFGETCSQLKESQN